MTDTPATASDDAGKKPGRVTPFDAYEVHGVAEFGEGRDRYCERVPDEKAQFWSLYGHAPGEGVQCIGNFKTRRYADEVLSRITGGVTAERLRQAAPQLLEACELLDWAYRDGETAGAVSLEALNDAWALARAAITLATGRGA